MCSVFVSCPDVRSVHRGIHKRTNVTPDYNGMSFCAKYSSTYRVIGCTQTRLQRTWTFVMCSLYTNLLCSTKKGNQDWNLLTENKTTHIEQQFLLLPYIVLQRSSWSTRLSRTAPSIFLTVGAVWAKPTYRKSSSWSAGRGSSSSGSELAKPYLHEPNLVNGIQ